MRCSRKLKSLIAATTAAFAVAVIPALALADVESTLSVTIDDPKLGAHSDVLVVSQFSYPLDTMEPDQQAAQADLLWREAVKNLVVDIPPGLMGNPNAIPYEDRCDPVVFETSVCPASSRVGRLSGNMQSMGTEQDYLDFGYSPGGANVPISGYLTLLKTPIEVPAEIGIYASPSLSGYSPERQRLKIEPVGDDLKLRTVTDGPIVNQQPLPSDASQINRLRVQRLNVRFWGTLENGNNFMTNPTECAPWTFTQWSEAYIQNSNADSDPLGTGTNTYAQAAPSVVTPDCSNQADIPFPITGAVAISSTKRDVSPDFDFTIENPGVQANGQVSTSPKKIVARVPAAINVDIQQLGRTCLEADFETDTCPAGSRVGSVKIETPLLVAGLSGDVFIIKKPAAGLPDLGLKLRGPIDLSQRGRTNYVGVKGNEIETTFDNIPQVGFSKLTFHLDGGPNGLLRTLACPVNNQQPVPGNFTYEFTSWTGVTKSSTTPLNAADCFGIQKLRSFQCVYRLLRFQPTYTSRARIKQSVLYVDGRKITTAKKVPFGFKVRAKRFKKGWHKIEVRATYDDGTLVKKRSRFKRC